MVEQAVLEPAASDERGPGRPADTIASWLAEHGGARADPEALVAALCEQLVAAGLPLSRASLGIPTLHRQLCGYHFVWRRGAKAGSKTRHEHGKERSEHYLDSPFRVIDEGAAAARRRLDIARPQLDFPILRELAAEGATDYVAMPLRFTSGWTGYISWACDRPGGFSAADLSRLEGLLPLMALRLELEASYRMSEACWKPILAATRPGASWPARSGAAKASASAWRSCYRTRADSPPWRTSPLQMLCPPGKTWSFPMTPEIFTLPYAYR